MISTLHHHYLSPIIYPESSSVIMTLMAIILILHCSDNRHLHPQNLCRQNNRHNVHAHHHDPHQHHHSNPLPQPQAVERSTASARVLLVIFNQTDSAK